MKWIKTKDKKPPKRDGVEYLFASAVGLGVCIEHVRWVYNDWMVCHDGDSGTAFEPEQWTVIKKPRLTDKGA